MGICCPNCGSTNIKKNGHIHNGKQNHQCNRCGHQFVQKPTQKRISDSKKLMNHIGAIKYFICHYNLEKALLV